MRPGVWPDFVSFACHPGNRPPRLAPRPPGVNTRRFPHPCRPLMVRRGRKLSKLCGGGATRAGIITKDTKPAGAHEVRPYSPNSNRNGYSHEGREWTRRGTACWVGLPRSHRRQVSARPSGGIWRTRPSGRGRPLIRLGDGSRPAPRCSRLGGASASCSLDLRL